MTFDKTEKRTTICASRNSRSVRGTRHSHRQGNHLHIEDTYSERLPSAHEESRCRLLRREDPRGAGQRLSAPVSRDGKSGSTSKMDGLCSTSHQRVHRG